MRFTFQGALVMILILFPSVIFYYTISVIPGILLAVVKYCAGERAAKPIYPLYNVCQGHFQELWFMFVASVLETVHGTKVSYTVADGAGQEHLERSGSCVTDVQGRKRPRLWHALSPPSGPGKVKIVMLNHHCRVDWVYLFLFCARSSLTSTLRIVLKEDLKKLPMMGSAMEHYRFLFLSRKWQDDEPYLKDMVAYFRRTGTPTTVLIFPEGTDLSPSNVVKSQAFARENNLPVLHHVLNPRTTGLIALKNMFGEENVEEIIDCTMGYTYRKANTRPAELSLVDGTHPHRIHLLLRRYRLDSTTSPNSDDLQDTAPGKDDEALKRWLNTRFTEKEQLLSRFYRSNPVGFDDHDVRAVMGEQCGVLSYVGGQEADTPKSRVTAFAGEVGWGRVAVNLLCWFFYPLYVVTHIHPLGLLVYLVFAFYAQKTIMKRFRGIQRTLLLHQVSDDESLFAKLSGRLAQREKAH